MLAIISPSKNLNANPLHITDEYSIPVFLKESNMLIEKLRTFNPKKLQKMMGINSKLAALNFERFHNWTGSVSPSDAHRAILMFNGEVFNGLQAKTLPKNDLDYSQDKIRILSGLYGLLRPLDLVEPYRLEMGTQMNINRKKGLYKFWGNNLTDNLNSELSGHKEKVLVNLASDEYFNAINPKKVDARIIKCQFKEERNGKLQFVTIFGKKARGLMVRFMIENRVEHPEELKTFDAEGYYFNSSYSTEDYWMFSR